MTSSLHKKSAEGDRVPVEQTSSSLDDGLFDLKRFSSGDKGVSDTFIFLLHLDCPVSRKPFANGLLSIFSLVMRSFYVKQKKRKRKKKLIKMNLVN